MPEPKLPCGCDSTFFHLATCPKVHPDIAALPAVLPDGVRVRTEQVPECPHLIIVIDAVDSSESEPVLYMLPREARALARELLLKADEAERQARDAA